MDEFTLQVPASLANIGPGFDVLGVGLNLFLTVKVHVDPLVDTSADTYNARITYEGDGAASVPLDLAHNLLTRTALYVMRCNGVQAFPRGTLIHVHNPIPLGRGLGSSGAAIVGGVMLGNEVAQLHMSKERMLDYCLMIERHPDNIAAAMLGGFVGLYLNELDHHQTAAKSVDLECILPKHGHTDAARIVLHPPPLHIGQYLKYDWCRKIRCVAVIPQFEVSTETARAVLPTLYTKPDIVFNLQRLAVLTTALTQSEPNHRLIFEAMKDKIHQPYRAQLIPGLVQVLQSVTPDLHPGLCGICLLGAGPTILCLATDNFDAIARAVVDIFAREGVKCQWQLLDLAHEGATVARATPK